MNTVTYDPELGRRLWGRRPLPEGATLVGAISIDGRSGTLVKLTGGRWAIGGYGMLTVLDRDDLAGIRLPGRTVTR